MLASKWSLKTLVQSDSPPRHVFCCAGLLPAAFAIDVVFVVVTIVVIVAVVVVVAVATTADLGDRDCERLRALHLLPGRRGY